MNLRGSGQRAEVDLAPNDGALSGGESQHSYTTRIYMFIRVSGKAEMISVGKAGTIPPMPGPYGQDILLTRDANTISVSRRQTGQTSARQNV